ncbi:vacuolar protein 8-like [Argonauta hians]
MEKQALANLLQYLETEETLTIEFPHLISLRVLIYSDNIELQLSAALFYLEISERIDDCPTSVTLSPLIDLLRRKDDRLNRITSQALSNFLMRIPACKSEVYPCQPVPALIPLLESKNHDTLCNTIAILTVLAITNNCRLEILAEDGVKPLLKTLHHKDVRVIRNAVGLIFNLTQLAVSRDEIVREGGVPLLISVLQDCGDNDIRYYCFGAMGNIAATPENRQVLFVADKKLLMNYLLVHNLSSESEKVTAQCLLTLRNLASDALNQEELALGGAIEKIHEIVQSTKSEEILNLALSCLRNLSNFEDNQVKFVSEEFLSDLGNILRDSTNPDAQHSAASIIRNLVDGKYMKIIKLKCLAILLSVMMVPKCSLNVLVEITGSVSILAAEEDVRYHLAQTKNGKVFQTLVSLASNPSSPELQYNCAGSLCQILIENIITDGQKERSLPYILQYLQDFLRSNDANFIHLALWTIKKLTKDEVFLKAFRDKRIETAVQSVTCVTVAKESDTIGKLIPEVLRRLKMDLLT